MLNLYIFLLVFFFIVVPQITADFNPHISIEGNLSDPTVNQTVFCTAQYIVAVAVDDPIQLIMDFIQGSVSISIHGGREKMAAISQTTFSNAFI